MSVCGREKQIIFRKYFTSLAGHLLQPRCFGAQKREKQDSLLGDKPQNVISQVLGRPTPPRYFLLLEPHKQFLLVKLWIQSLWNSAPLGAGGVRVQRSLPRVPQIPARKALFEGPLRAPLAGCAASTCCGWCHILWKSALFAKCSISFACLWAFTYAVPFIWNHHLFQGSAPMSLSLGGLTCSGPEGGSIPLLVPTHTPRSTGFAPPDSIQ